MRCLVLLLLLLGSLPALAQSSPSSPEPDSLAAIAAPAEPDTAAAIHRLFAAKRGKRSFLVGLALVGTTISYLAARQAYSIDSGVASLAIGVVMVPLGLTALIGYRPYSKRHEQETVEAFHAHRLPPDIRRKLQKRYFQPLPVSTGSRR